MKENIQACNNVLELIGDTPLVKLNRIMKGFPGNFYGKIESFNPGHSTKDRIALYIIEDCTLYNRRSRKKRYSEAWQYHY